MIESFDVLEFLDDRGIPYVTEGKNVSYGWAEINCPFCPDGDPSEHLKSYHAGGVPRRAQLKSSLLNWSVVLTRQPTGSLSNFKTGR